MSAQAGSSSPAIPSTHGYLAALLLVQIGLYVVSLPGFGIETRTFTQYATWAGPVFLVLTVVIFAFSVAGVVSLRTYGPRAARFALITAVASIVIILFDFSGVGGPKPPTGPLVLGIIGILVALAILAVVRSVLAAAPTAPSPLSAP